MQGTKKIEYVFFQNVFMYFVRVSSSFKVKKLKLPVLVGTISAIQPPFDITSPEHRATIGNWVSLGKLFHSRFCVQPRNIKLVQTQSSQVTS